MKIKLIIALFTFCFGATMQANNEIDDHTVNASNLFSVYQQLVDGKSSSLNVVIIKAAYGKCKQKGTCVEVIKFQDGSKKKKTSYTTLSKTNWYYTKGGKGHFFFSGIPTLARYDYSKNTVYILKAKMSYFGKLYNKLFWPDGVKGIPVQTQVIPPQIYEPIMGNNCCSDCWAVHRTFYLPCGVDAICCAGSCPKNPDCVGVDVPGNPTVPGGSEEECDSTSEMVSERPLELSSGVICEFSGVLETVPGEDGSCVTIPVSGVFENCIGVGPAGGGSSDPATTEEANGGYF